MPLNFLETPEERRRRSTQAQTATNASPLMKLAQQFTQPASNFVAPVTGTTGAVAAPPAPPQRGLRMPTQAAPAEAVNRNAPPSSPTSFQYGTPTLDNPAGAVNTTAPPRSQGLKWPPSVGGATTPPPAAPPVPAPAAAPAAPNSYGNRANLDPTYIEQQVRAAFAKKGVANPSAEEVSYWVTKATTPDIYSDNKVRVGWNPYWEDRLIQGSASSDPRLAGDEGLIANPAQYGLRFNITSGPGYTGPGQTTGDLPVTPTTPGGGGTGDGGHGGGGGTAPPPPTDPMLNNAGMDQAYAALLRALGMAVPDAAGLKEASKENLLASSAASQDQLMQQAQARGLGRSGVPLGLSLEAGDRLSGDLAKSNRDIELASQQQGFNNLSDVARGFQSYGEAQFGQQFSLKQLEQNAEQFASQMGFNYAQLSQNDRQFFQSLALNRWIAEQNASQRQMEILLGGLG